jgi:predicted ABC-type exoprotein transport system permease subunit
MILVGWTKEAENMSTFFISVSTLMLIFALVSSVVGTPTHDERIYLMLLAILSGVYATYYKKKQTPD